MNVNKYFSFAIVVFLMALLICHCSISDGSTIGINFLW